MKAYKDDAGNTRMFRPDMNMTRLHRSAHRLALPVRVKETGFNELFSFDLFYV